MKKIVQKLGKVIAAMALVVTTMTVNSTCIHYVYQDEIPECAKKLSKIK